MVESASLLRVIDGCLDTPLAKAVGAFLLAYVVYRFGRSAYFSQKESEHSRERYLDNGVDLVAANVDYALGVHRHNWTLFLRYLKLYRDSLAPINFDDFFIQFRELDQSRLQIAPAHRLQSLLASDVFWVGYQLAFSFVSNKNDLMKADFALTLHNATAADADVDKDGVVKIGESLAEDMSVESQKFYKLLSQLMDLAAIIEGSRLNRRSLSKIRERADVRKLVSVLREIFPDDPIERVSLKTEAPTNNQPPRTTQSSS